jgi:hypothetical protein
MIHSNPCETTVLKICPICVSPFFQKHIVFYIGECARCVCARALRFL